MKAILKQYGFAVFLIIALTHLAGILLESEAIRFITKPLLMPVLALAVYVNSTAGKKRTLLVIAILFSFAGDSFLLFDYINASYFIFGLVSFLITHILYIVYFLRLKPIKSSLLKQQPWIILLVIIYGVGLVYLLFPKLGDLKVPVIVYAAIICTMLLCSIHICRSVNATAATLFVVGALFFVISDSLLAINKFNAPFRHASFLIMFTYCAAQYFIASGFVKANGWKQI